MPLTSRVALTITASQTAALDLVTATVPLTRKIVQDFAAGVGANQADRMFSDTRTLAPSAFENLDLAGGSLLDALGAPITFVKVKALLVVAAASNANSISVGGDANMVPFFVGLDDFVLVKPGGTLLLVAPNAAGYPVTPGTGDLLQLVNGGGGTSVTYDIVIIGTSA